jgi:GH15 family glucan-1,4-alpha-glucosidase
MSAPSLVEASRRVIRDGQAPSGAYLAAPTFPNYQYSWFRDGAFIAHAMHLAGESNSARRFHEWAIGVVLREAGKAESAVARSRAGLPMADGQYLRARYPPDGVLDDDHWPNFQLDGLGSWLWSLQAYAAAAGTSLPGMTEAVQLVARYLGQLWQTPCFDCWEENSDQVHVSTLSAIHAGLMAAAALLDSSQWAEEAAAVRAFVLQHGTVDGMLRKHLGTDQLDASLLWAATPFRLVEPAAPLMRRTADQLAQSLTGPSGGTRRYLGDTYYGGGEWVLLTAHLGWYWAELGEWDKARRALLWVERAADGQGWLPEQVVSGAQRPDQVSLWTARWGAVAKPLLWSHATYLILRHALELG